MKRFNWRPVAAIGIVAVTIVVFVLYIAQHPSVRQQLRQTSPGIIALLLALYAGTVLALTLVTIATLRLCKIKLPLTDSLLLTMYTAVINFFGPLQSGPALRAVYVKKKYGLSLKKYAAATFMYYGCFGGLSVLLLFSSLLKWWLLVLAAAGLAVALAASRSTRFKPRLAQLDLNGWYYLAAATLTQVLVLTFIYYVELRAVQPGVHFSQALVYTGAANLALFVSLTPGAIGFRESFLVFSKHLHHISNSTIVAANIIDRAVYVILLLILTVFIFGTHAKRHFNADTKEE